MIEIMSRDVLLLNGIGQEGIALIFECFGAIFVGLFLGFWFDYRITSVALAIFPILSFSVFFQLKI